MVAPRWLGDVGRRNPLHSKHFLKKKIICSLLLYCFWLLIWISCVLHIFVVIDVYLLVVHRYTEPI